MTIAIDVSSGVLPASRSPLAVIVCPLTPMVISMWVVLESPCAAVILSANVCSVSAASWVPCDEDSAVSSLSPQADRVRPARRMTAANTEDFREIFMA